MDNSIRVIGDTIGKVNREGLVRAKERNTDIRYFSNFEEDSLDGNSEGSSRDNDASHRLSKYIKGKTFRYKANGKIYFEVGKCLKVLRNLRMCCKII